jgi:hypothetical protein
MNGVEFWNDYLVIDNRDNPHTSRPGVIQASDPSPTIQSDDYLRRE